LLSIVLYYSQKFIAQWMTVPYRGHIQEENTNALQALFSEVLSRS